METSKLNKKPKFLPISSLIFWLALCAISVVGITTEIQLTHAGPGVTGDSIHYLEGARNLISGHGYSRLRADGTHVPITGFPPFFSIVLAGANLLDGSVLDSSRYVNALLLGINITLVGVILHRLTHSSWAALLGGLFTLLSQEVLLTHAWVMSEALFICLTLLGLIGLLQYFRQGKRGYILLAGVFAGLAVVTRYVGLSLIPASCAGLLLITHDSLRRRLVNTLYFGSISVLPLSGLLLRNSMVASSMTARQTLFHPISRNLIVAFFDETSSWFVPNDLHFSWRQRLVTFGVFILICGALFLWEIYRQRLDRNDFHARSIWFQIILVLFIVLYLIIVVANTLYLDASTTELGIRRYLVPVFMCGLLWVILVLYHSGWVRFPHMIPRILLTTVALGLLGLYAYRATSFVMEPGYVFGYTDFKNAVPEAVAALKAIDPDRPIVANDLELVYFLAGRPPYATSYRFDHFTQQANPEFETEMREIEALIQQGAILVIVEELEDTPPELENLISSLVPWQTFSRITFYVAPDFIE